MTKDSEFNPEEEAQNLVEVLQEMNLLSPDVPSGVEFGIGIALDDAWERGEADEQGRVVSWLRSIAPRFDTGARSIVSCLASAIERGDHKKSEKEKTDGD